MKTFRYEFAIFVVKNYTARFYQFYMKRVCWDLNVFATCPTEEMWGKRVFDWRFVCNWWNCIRFEITVICRHKTQKMKKREANEDFGAKHRRSNGIGEIWKRLDRFEKDWRDLENTQEIWSKVEICEKMWRDLNKIEEIWKKLRIFNEIGEIWRKLWNYRENQGDLIKIKAVRRRIDDKQMHKASWKKESRSIVAGWGYSLVHEYAISNSNCSDIIQNYPKREEMRTHSTCIISIKYHSILKMWWKFELVGKCEIRRDTNNILANCARYVASKSWKMLNCRVVSRRNPSSHNTDKRKS